jgi:hypothetical protein
MGNSKAIFATGTTLATAALTVVACGSDSAKTPDAPVKLIDAAIDAPAHVVDAPPDAPAYDFTCFGSAQGSSAPATITVSGTTYTITQTGSAAVAGVTVDAYKNGVVAPLATGTSNGSGVYSLTVPTGTMALNGYIKGSKTANRTTYMYPPNPLVADLSMAPVLMVSDAVWTFLTSPAALNVTQDDANNGVVIAAAVDCQNKPITGATVTIEQGGSAAGSAMDLSSFGFPGTLAFNVPDGNTDVGATFGSMTFPSHVVVAHKKPNGAGAEGTLTITVVRPGP